MKWILSITKYTNYVAKCAHAIAEAAKTLSSNWPTDNPFKRTPNPAGDVKA